MCECPRADIFHRRHHRALCQSASAGVNANAPAFPEIRVPSSGDISLLRREVDLDLAHSGVWSREILFVKKIKIFQLEIRSNMDQSPQIISSEVSVAAAGD